MSPGLSRQLAGYHRNYIGGLISAYIEIVISFLLLIASTWYLRKFAGKIFEISMLMYGKEPTWREILKWVKASSN